MVNVMDLFCLDGKVIVATGATGYLCSHFVEAVAQAGGSLAWVFMFTFCGSCSAGRWKFGYD